MLSALSPHARMKELTSERIRSVSKMIGNLNFFYRNTIINVIVRAIVRNVISINVVYIVMFPALFSLSVLSFILAYNILII